MPKDCGDGPKVASSRCPLFQIQKHTSFLPPPFRPGARTKKCIPHAKIK